MERSNSCGVWPAASSGPIKGKEIVPAAVTRGVEPSSRTSNTVTSIKSSLPIRYSGPPNDVGVLESLFVMKSSWGMGLLNRGNCPAQTAK